MRKEKIDRINELAKKAKGPGLNEAELLERDTLRQEYLAAIRDNLTDQLEHTYIVDKNGSKRKLKRND